MVENVAPTAYGLCGLTPEQLWAMVPRDYQALEDARVKYADTRRDFLDSEMADLKFLYYATKGGEDHNRDDFKLIHITPDKVVDPGDDDYLKRTRETMRGWCAATGGKHGND